MERGSACCPVCTLYLRAGITLQAHLETHPKDKVIEALLKVTNGGQTTGETAPSPSTLESATAETLVPAQQYVSPNSAFIAQTQNYVNPQTQVTAAVTYQQFVTSNGSTVMPQYIQVPAIVAPSSSVAVIPNQPVNYVPNQPNAYAHTMYNPLYNPYIPQPYPLVQPVYANIPVTNETNTQVPTSQDLSPAATSSSDQTTETEKQETVTKEVTSVATNTCSNKELKFRAKRVPVRSAMQTKFRLIRQLGSRLKTATSTMATLATKSFKITSLSGKSNSAAKTSVITKAKSCRTRSRVVIPRQADSASTSRIISPPPLTPMTTSRSGSVPCSLTPPPPPLSKAPCLSSVSSSSFDPDNVKREESPELGESEEKDCESAEKSADYIIDHEVPTVNSVIVESNSAVQIGSNIVVSSVGENVSGFDDKSMLPRITTVESEPGTAEKCTDTECDEFDAESDQCDDLGNGQDRGSSYDDEEVQDKVFNTFQFEEEKKVAFNFDLVNQDIPKAITSENIDRNCDGSEIFIQQESIPFREENLRHKADDIAFGESGAAVVPSRGGSSTPVSIVNKSSAASFAAAKGCAIRLTTDRTREQGSLTDIKSLTYTDLQPATNSKMLQDFGLTSSFEFNNYMEVDGIKIFFNNTNVQNVPLEPIIKFTSNLKADGKKVQNYMKSEGEVRDNETIVESVIHLVSGPQQKNDYSGGEMFTNSGSHPTDGHADLRDLSPLTLNIRADESMPARGELSEQESLGAENSNWSMFQSGVSNAKAVEVLRTETVAPVSGSKRTEPKTFKCAFCPEVFPSLKERRVHRTVAHENIPTPPRKPKTFECIHCKEKFTSLRDRRRHVIQSHYVDVSKVKKIKQENDGKDEVGTLTVDGPQHAALVSLNIKQEEDEAMVKNETPADAEGKSTMAATKTCPQCELSFEGLKKLREHLRAVHGMPSRYKCGTCSETFGTEADYNSHLRIHPLECTQCGKLFSRKPNLKLHLRRHLVVKPYKCMQCPKSFITRQKLDEHMNGHTGIKPLKCSLCDKTFSRHSNLIQHRNTHHIKGKKKVKDYVCRCGEVFHSSRKLEWHKEVHDTKPKTCPFCSQKFIHSNSVTRHIRRSHIPHYLPREDKDNGNVQCPICGKIYLRSSLIVHMRVHNGVKPFVCKICNKRFTTKWNLELHNWTHQSRNNMPFKCTICKSAFFREVDYSAHINSHRNYKPFTCNICGQKFIRKYNCLRHQEEHKREKKFVCTVSGCEKSFHRSYYLRDHMTVHTGFRPHTCHICGKASSTKSNHNKHVRIHDTREPLNTEN